MRTSISSITKPFYKDIVDIFDHPRTREQVIGDRLLKNPTDKSAVKLLKLHKQLWSTEGRDVPGIRANIYFWDIKDNKESRPTAGLSACNLTEAEAAVNLTKFLLLCGVPSTSISIITPYKGQKTLITKELLKAKVIEYSSSRNFSVTVILPHNTNIIAFEFDAFEITLGEGYKNDAVLAINSL